MPPEHLQELIENRKLRLERHLRLLQQFQRLKESIEVQKQLVEQCGFVLHTVQESLK
jgi:hypothetical protein